MPTETFEGLGIGSRLAVLKVGEKNNWIPVAAALLYGLTTPIGIAAGLGVRSTYNPGTATASAVSGIMDAVSAGILIYASLVEVRTSRSTTRIECVVGRYADDERLVYLSFCYSLWHMTSYSTRRCWPPLIRDSPSPWDQCCLGVC